MQAENQESLASLKARIERLERELLSLQAARAETSRARRRLEGRRMWENIPLTALIIFLAWLAAHWVYQTLWP